MAKKSLGYVELEWTCPSCGSKNPGTVTVCTSCGAPQPADVQFEQPAQENLITDAEKLEKVTDAPDIHCAYCGARNPAGAQTCSRCGADLSEGAAREKGRVIGAHRPDAAPDVICPACGTSNPATAHRCRQCNANLDTSPAKPASRPTPKAADRRRNNTVIYAVIVVAIFACAALAFLLLRTEEVVGEVQSVQWTRTIAIEELGPVEYDNWRDEIPGNATLGSCEERVRSTQDNPAPNAIEVCGTPYTVDTGTGVGEVVQDCQYEVYDDWCSYTVQEWLQVDEISASAPDFNPYWPEPQLRTGQREGERSEEYEVFFNADGDSYTYDTSNLDTYMQCEIGSNWLLEVNTFNAVLSISPKN